MQAVCVECHEVVDNAVAALNGDMVCAGCVAYYAACAGCNGLIPRDDSPIRDEKLYCADCFARAALGPGVETPTEEEIQTLTKEYIALYAQRKGIERRMDFIKERLKAAASLRQRIGNAVPFETDEGAVVCTYKTSIQCDEEKLPELESRLGPDLFSTLFVREVTYKPVKERIKEFLSLNDAESEPLREAVRDAVEEVETPSLSVPRKKK